MKFYDVAKITVVAGKGGDGAVAGRKEAFVPYGGPAGGNGGKGGDVYFIGNKNINTLEEFKYKKIREAENGEKGKGKQMDGKKGNDLLIEIPIGTYIFDVKNNQLICHIKKHGEKFLIAKGGEGGKGNTFFKNDVLQYPSFATLGEPGEKKELILRLLLLADVALIGEPNVGKTSLINSICHTKAKVSNYPFTTLIPTLGNLKENGVSINILDVPGLIKGANKGKGLGYDFLRHVVKSKVFSIVVDMSEYEIGIKKGIEIVKEIFIYLQEHFYAELEENFDLKGQVVIDISVEKGFIFLNYYLDENLIFQKIFQFVFNKFDLINDEEIVLEIQNKFFKEILKLDYFKNIKLSDLKNNSFVVSAATHFGLQKLVDSWVFISKNIKIKELEFVDTVNTQQKKQEIYIKDVTDKEIDFLVEEGYLEDIEAEGKVVWEIYNSEICKLVWTTMWGNEEAEQYFWQQMENFGFLDWLKENGVYPGDVLKIKNCYGRDDDRYVLYLG